MAIKDFMTTEVVSVTSDTKVSKAATIMEEKNIHRLPVIDNQRLVGLVTIGTIQQATPSKATSLSVYEMNYLLNKTTVKDVMIQKVHTITPNQTLEDGIFVMRNNNIGVLPVLEDEKVVGIITDKDIFDAFLHIAGFGEKGARIVLRLSAAQNHPGSLAKVTKLIAEADIDIQTLIVNPQKDNSSIIEVQTTASKEALQKVFLDTEFEQKDIFETGQLLVENGNSKE